MNNFTKEQQHNHVTMIIKWVSGGMQIQICQTSPSLHQEIVQLRPNEYFYEDSIDFTNANIVVGLDQGNTLDSLPDDGKVQIFFQQVEYHLKPEEIIALYFGQFQRIIGKKWIIEEVQIQTQNEGRNKQLLRACALLNLHNVVINGDTQKECEITENDKQHVRIILSKQQKFLKYKRNIENVQRIIKEMGDSENPKYSNFMNINIDKSYTSEEIHEIYKQFTMNERLKYQLFDLDDTKCLYHVSKWMESIEDIINLQFAMKNAQYTFTMFEYNPVSLTEKTIGFFPRLKTLCLYSKEDEVIKGNYSKCVALYLISWNDHKSLELTDKNYKKVTFPKLIFTTSDLDMILMNDSKKHNSNGKNIYDLVIPEGVCEIEDKLIQFKDNISSVSIPCSVTSIGRHSFYQCTSLKSLSIQINDYRMIVGNKLFIIKNNHLEGISIPSTVKMINGKPIEELESLTIPFNITSIGDDCFDECTSLKIISIPSTVQYIGNNCFNNCTNIKMMVLPESISEINTTWFYSCRELTHLVLSDSITTFPPKMFYNFSKLRQINIPTRLESFPEQCFYNCSSLKEIHFGNHIKSIGERCFEKCSSLNTITLPNTIKSFNTTWFIDCKNLSEMIIPESFDILPYDSFLHLPIQSLNVSKEWNTKGQVMFKIKDKCLYSVQLPTTIKMINNHPVEYIELTQCIIPYGVTRLADYCFSNCSKMTRIDGIQGIQEIGQKCFMNTPNFDHSRYPLIRENIIHHCGITTKQILTLENWTNKKIHTVLFDSDLDNWDIHTSELNQRIVGMKQLLFLIEDEDGEKFGYYVDSEIQNFNIRRFTVDQQSFLFNLESNGWLNEPMKFEIIKSNFGRIITYDSDANELITLGDIHLMKKQMKHKSGCYQHEEYFNYHGIKNALCGKIYNDSHFSIPKRFLVIHMN